VYDRSSSNRHGTHHPQRHPHFNTVNDSDKQFKPPSLTRPSTVSSEFTADPIDILNSIISLLYPASSSSTPTIVPYVPTATPGAVSLENATIILSEPKKDTVHPTHTKTANHHHTTTSITSTVGVTRTHHSANHEIHIKTALNTKSMLAAQETKSPYHHAKQQHVPQRPSSQQSDQDTESDGQADDNDGDDDVDSGRGGGSDTDGSQQSAHLPMVTPSATIIHLMPSLTTASETPTKTQTGSEMVQAERANKIIGIVVGLGCVVVGAAGLAGFIVSRRRDKASQISLEQGDVQTRWRPQSFVAVVATAVSRLQKTCSRDNSVKSNTVSEHRSRLAVPTFKTVEAV
jgi:hypothetical protein